MEVSIGKKVQNETDSGFKGYIKGFKLFKERFENPKYWKNAAFQYLHPEGNPSLMLELTLNDKKNTSGRLEQVNQVVFEPFGTGYITQEQDFSPSWHCFHQSEEDFSHQFRFQGENTQL